VQHVLEIGYAFDLNDVEIPEIGRDPFLVAATLAGEDRVVATREVSQPTEKRAQRRVPHVCAVFNIAVITDFALYRLPNFSIR
jgi:hypothetical protein